MNLSFLFQHNYLAIIVATLIYFMLGYIWFSILFKQMWVNELENHNVVITEPSKNNMFQKLLLTFISNFVTVFAISCLVRFTDSRILESGLLVGVIAAIGFAATAIAGVFIWESRSLKLFLIDAGYNIVAIIIAAILLSLWH